MDLPPGGLEAKLTKRKFIDWWNLRFKKKMLCLSQQECFKLLQSLNEFLKQQNLRAFLVLNLTVWYPLEEDWESFLFYNLVTDAK